MLNIKNCCYGCKDRNLGCHGTCLKYAEFKAEQKRIKEIENRDIMITNSLDRLRCNKYSAIKKSRKEV